MKNLILALLFTGIATAQDITITADGITLTAQETATLAAAESQRLAEIERTKQWAQQAIKGLETYGPEVLSALKLTAAQRNAYTVRLTQARDDIVLTARKRVELLHAVRPSAIEIRRARLASELTAAQELVALEQRRLEALTAEEDPAVVDARTAALATAQQAVTDAQAAADAFNTEHPAP